ncbi:MAG: hypothetical protein GW748_01880 [Alphaproteobacteria bacterium]|nr:hypothetical protein [Alphaproteobacteria bacterium]NCQ66480.1 hypothetical protein [Alphaproteobacteria bacterium]
MTSPKEMPAPCKDEQTNDFQVKNSKFPPLSQVDNCRSFGDIVSRLVFNVEAQIAHKQYASAGKLGLRIGAMFPSREHPLEPLSQVCVEDSPQSKEHTPNGGADV